MIICLIYRYIHIIVIIVIVVPHCQVSPLGSLSNGSQTAPTAECM